MDYLTIKCNKWRLLSITIGSLLMFIASIAMLHTVIVHYHDTGYQSTALLRYKNTSLIISSIGIIFFGIGFMAGVYQSIKGHILMDINDYGLNYHSCTSGTIVFLWKDIKEVSSSAIANNAILCVSLNNPDDFMRKCSYLDRRLMRANVSLGYPPITIGLNAVKENPKDIVSVINGNLTEWKRINNVIGVESVIN